MRITFLKIAVGILAATTFALQASSTISSDACSSSSSNSPLPSKKKLLRELNDLGSNTNLMPSREIWAQCKPIVTALIKQHNTHPDDIRVSSPYDFWVRPLEKSVELNDVEFAEFLLVHKADIKDDYLLLDIARTKKMAELLFRYGAPFNDKNILRSDWGWDKPSSLTSFLIRKGAEVNNGSEHGDTPLFSAINYLDGQAYCRCYPKRHLDHIKTLLNEPILISPRITYDGDGDYHEGYTAPTMLKVTLDSVIAQDSGMLEAIIKEPKIRQLNEIRTLMKKAHEREYHFTRKAVEEHLLPELADLVVETYEELEKVPEPASRS